MVDPTLVLFGAFIKIMITIVIKLIFVITLLATPLILFSIGLMRIAKSEGEQSYLAWIPIINLYLVGKMGINKTMGVILSFLGLLTFITIIIVNIYDLTNLTMMSQLIGMLLTSILLIGNIALHHIYATRSQYAFNMTLFTFLSFGLLAPFFIFSISNNPPKTLI